MKKYKTSDTLTEGDIVELQLANAYGVVSTVMFKAVRFNKTKPCIKQCHMAGLKDRAYCTGFCFRWENGDNFVFVNASEDSKNVTITQTSAQKSTRKTNKS